MRGARILADASCDLRSQPPVRGLRDRRRALFCRVGIQQEFELGRIKLLARHSEHASGQRVDGLAEHLDFRGLTVDDGIASGDFIKQMLAFGVVHFRQDEKQSTCHEDM